MMEERETKDLVEILVHQDRLLKQERAETQMYVFTTFKFKCIRVTPYCCELLLLQ
jgi:hypothetical protein